MEDEWIQEKVRNVIHKAFEENCDVRSLVKELVPEYVIRNNNDVLEEAATVSYTHLDVYKRQVWRMVPTV